jgi:hypothetical protein
MEKRVIRFFLNRTRAGLGHADGPPVETGRKDWAAPELVTGHFLFLSSTRVSSMDQSTCLRSKGLHVRVVHVGPCFFFCSRTNQGVTMRKRNTPIRMITVRPAQPRKRMVLALARRFGIGADARRETQNPHASPGHACRSDGLDLDLDQRVRLLGEW